MLVKREFGNNMNRLQENNHHKYWDRGKKNYERYSKETKSNTPLTKPVEFNIMDCIPVEINMMKLMNNQEFNRINRRNFGQHLGRPPDGLYSLDQRFQKID